MCGTPGCSGTGKEAACSAEYACLVATDLETSGCRLHCAPGHGIIYCCSYSKVVVCMGQFQYNGSCSPVDSVQSLHDDLDSSAAHACIHTSWIWFLGVNGWVGTMQASSAAASSIYVYISVEVWHEPHVYVHANCNSALQTLHCRLQVCAQHTAQAQCCIYICQRTDLDAYAISGCPKLSTAVTNRHNDAGSLIVEAIYKSPSARGHTAVGRKDPQEVAGRRAP
jgi:hypothetical protein